MNWVTEPIGRARRAMANLAALPIVALCLTCASTDARDQEDRVHDEEFVEQERDPHRNHSGTCDPINPCGNLGLICGPSSNGCGGVTECSCDPALTCEQGSCVLGRDLCVDGDLVTGSSRQLFSYCGVPPVEPPSLPGAQRGESFHSSLVALHGGQLMGQRGNPIPWLAAPLSESDFDGEGKLLSSSPATDVVAGLLRNDGHRGIMLLLAPSEPAEIVRLVVRAFQTAGSRNMGFVVTVPVPEGKPPAQEFGVIQVCRPGPGQPHRLEIELTAGPDATFADLLVQAREKPKACLRFREAP